MSTSHRTENLPNKSGPESSNPFSDQNITDDPTAPELYSPKAIFGFTFFFGVIFGGILLALNLKRIHKTSAIIPLLVGAILFTIAQITLIPDDSSGRSLGMLSSFIAGTIYRYGLWPNLIGSNLEYRKRAVLTPILIGIAIATIFLFCLFVLTD